MHQVQRWRHGRIAVAAGLAVALAGCGLLPGSGVATWALADPAQLSPQSTRLELQVTRLDCASGETGRVLEPSVQYESDRVIIRTDVASLPPGDYACPGNNSVAVTVDLTEPLGQRELVDAACLDGEAVGTAPCSSGGVRWRP